MICLCSPADYHAPLVDRVVAEKQFRALLRALRAHGATVVVARSPQGCYDAAFMADAGLVVDGHALLARFRHTHRRPESDAHAPFFTSLGHVVHRARAHFEGGDVVRAADARVLYVGYGLRTERAAIDEIETLFPSLEVRPLELVDPEFFHLDMCFRPLPDGRHALVYPPALAEAAYAELRRWLVPIEVTREEAAVDFACNALCLLHGGRATYLCHRLSARLRARLATLGLRVQCVDVSEFLKGRGSVKCLTLLETRARPSPRRTLPARRVVPAESAAVLVLDPLELYRYTFTEDAISRVASLVADARARGVPVIVSRWVRTRGSLRDVADERGHWGMFVPTQREPLLRELDGVPWDLFLDAVYTDAFHPVYVEGRRTEDVLRRFLEARRIETLVIAGTWAEACVRRTTCSAAALGMTPVLLRAAIGGYDVSVLEHEHEVRAHVVDAVTFA